MLPTGPLLLPGSFVVLQGVPGDGLSNTIDTDMDAECLLEDVRDVASNRSQDEHASNNNHFTTDQAMVSELTEPSLEPEQHTTLQCTMVSPTLGGILAASNLMTTTPSLNLTRTAPGLTSAISNTSEESFVVVPDDSESSTHPEPRSDAPRRVSEEEEANADQDGTHPLHSSGSEKRVIDAWEAECLGQQVFNHAEWCENSGYAYSFSLPMWWTDQGGRLALFATLPHKSSVAGVHVPPTIATLAPGTTVIGTHVVTLDRESLEPMQNDTNHGDAFWGRDGTVQLLKVESPETGYVVLSFNGYAFLGPGLPGAYVDPQVWLWRVTCPAGAFVRQGLDLSTNHLCTIPYGSLVQVTRKTINSMGLVRLQIQACIDDKDNDDQGSSQRIVKGWCSEFLNPLSGQRGAIVQPLPFPLAALYKVTLPEGAVIRSDIELSSAVIGRAPCGSILSIVGRAFSEHPGDKCIERLKLAGRGGWISLRLNKAPPLDQLVVECIGIDSSFEPEQPGMFHLDAMRRVQRQQEQAQQQQEPSRQPQDETSDESAHMANISSVDETDDEGGHSTTSSSLSSLPARLDEAIDSHRQQQQPISNNHAVSRDTQQSVAYSARPLSNPRRCYGDDPCVVCLQRERNATLVHGETGHIVCCLHCARVMKAREDRCPVCRLPIDMVIQQFWA